MAQVPLARGAAHFGADHAVRGIDQFLHPVLMQGGGIAGPTAAGIELGVRSEQRRAAARAVIGAGGGVVFVLAGEGPLRPRLAQDGVLFRGQALAPFGIGQQQFVGHFLLHHQLIWRVTADASSE